MPCTIGYPGASEASPRAVRTGNGTRSTGVPTERSTSPSGCADATFLAGNRLSHGKSGSRVTGDVPGRPPAMVGRFGAAA